MKNLPVYIVFFFLSITFFGCKTSDTAIGSTDQYSFTGTNPFWKLEISTEQIVFTLLSGKKEVYPYKASVEGNNRKLFVTSREVEGEKSWLKISIEEKSCFNSSAGKKFPFKVEVDKDGKIYYGCGE